MAETFVVTDVSQTVNDWVAQGKYPMKEYRVHLQSQDPNAEPLLNVEWSRKAESPAPHAGQRIDVERFEDRGARGLKLHLAQNPGYSSTGGKDFKADPVKQAAIAMESAQKSAVEIMRLAMDCKAWTPPEDRPIGEMTGVVKTIAQALYAQIQEAAGGAS